MKHSRLVFTALAVLMAGGAALATACDDKQSSSAAAANTGNVSKCPYATRAAGATAVTAINHGACPASAGCPYTSAAACKAHGAAAVTAAASAGTCANGYSTIAATAANGACAHANASAVAASSGGCSGAAAAAGSCAGHGSKSAAAAAAGTSACGARTANGVTSCSGHGMTTAAARSTHADCDACLDMAGCERELESAGATTQVVSLKNGVMFVYTADSPASVHAVQAALARRSDHMAQLAAAGGKAHLCGSCKEMRGAQASGKLSREVVNIDGGCLTIVTSTDPALVARIHTMAGLSPNPTAAAATAAKVKS